MSKLKKILLLAIISVIYIVLLPGEVNAEELNLIDVESSKDLYCIEHGGYLSSHNKGVYTIDGTKRRKIAWTPNWELDLLRPNGIYKCKAPTLEEIEYIGNNGTIGGPLAYIFAKGEKGYSGGKTGYFENNNPANSYNPAEYSDTQLCVWKLWNEFSRQTGLDMVTGSNDNVELTPGANKLLNDANNYGKNVERNLENFKSNEDLVIDNSINKQVRTTKATDLFNGDKNEFYKFISKENNEYNYIQDAQKDIKDFNNYEYIMVGPLNWNYTNSSININSQDSSSILFARMNKSAKKDEKDIDKEILDSINSNNETLNNKISILSKQRTIADGNILKLVNEDLETDDFKIKDLIISNIDIIDSNTDFYMFIPVYKDEYYNMLNNNDRPNYNRPNFDNVEDNYKNIDISIGFTRSLEVYYANIDVLQSSTVLQDSTGANRNPQRLIRVGTETKNYTKSISLNYNLDAKTRLIIQKRDALNKAQPIPGVAFIFKNKQTGLYVNRGADGNINYVASENDATTFTTGQNGEVIVQGIEAGEYIAIEKNVTNANYTASTGTTTIINAMQGNTNYITIYNKKNPIEMTIKGKVWTPTKAGKDEASIKDTDPSNYKAENDLLVEGIKVELYRNARLKETYNENGQLSGVEMESINEELVGTTYTDKDGNYEFKIKVSYPEIELPAYKVKFTYDSIDFQGCAPSYNNKINGSKAIENTSQRNALNDKYATISGTENNDANKGYARDINGNVTSNLTYAYNNSDRKSYVNNLSAGYTKNMNIKRVVANKQLINPIEATYSLRANDPGGNPGGLSYLAGNTIQGINLGLLTREMPDLAVSNQISNVVTTVNGYNNLYKTTLTKTNRDPDNSDLKVGVTYVTDENKLSRFTIYPSDVKTWSADSNVTDKLQVFITYKVGITNESTTLYNRVRELAIYYDNNYQLQYIGNNLDANKNNYCATNEYKVSNSKYSNYNMQGYTKTCIEINDVISANTTKEIYMTFKVSDNEVKKMLEYSERGEKYTPKMNNVVEINSYSTYSDEAGTKVYAGVDKDSAAGNVNRIDDDTGIAKEFTISQSGTRTLTGTVFLDKTADELMTGKERQGNSIYNNAEDKTLKNVKVVLTGKQDNNSINKVTGAQVTTVANNYEAVYDKVTGDNTYIISGFIPGNYTIRYEYNNQTYYEDGNNKININAVDYKSAVVKNVAGETEVRTAFETGKDDWYKIDNPKKDGEGSFVRYNEAIDDFNTRKNIDNNYKTVDMRNTGNVTQNVTTSMTAQTPLMKIAVELNTLSNDNTFKPAYYNLINMDFGITERPRQQMKLNKEVSGVKVTLANGQILMDAVIENGKLKDNVAGMKVIGTNTDTQKGLIDIELDSELVHGATLEITYTIKATNIGEIDYLEEEYYKYGTGGNNKVTITPSKVVDYTSNDLIFDNTNKLNIDNKWNIVELDSIKQKEIDETGLLYADIKNNEIKKSNINTILQTTYWLDNKVALAPNETTNSKPLKLSLTKLLSNTDEDMTYNNDVELTQATKTGGRTIVTQIGKYTFETKEGIGGSSEEITITPPTGTTKSNTIYYIIATIGALVVLAGGITLIMVKRKREIAK